MMRIILIADGCPPDQGPNLAAQIHVEFVIERSTWDENVSCSWDGEHLVLQADRDDDSPEALMDEFSDVISAYADPYFDGDIIIQSTKLLD